VVGANKAKNVKKVELSIERLFSDKENEMAKTIENTVKLNEENRLEGQVKVTDMSVKGGDLPSTYSAKIDVTFDFQGVEPAELAENACGGQSLRVILQGRLRKRSTRELDKLATDGLTVQVNDLLSPVKRDPASAGKQAFGQMSAEQKYWFLVNDCGIDSEMAKMSTGFSPDTDGE
jgi:hypothetical protein